MASVAEDNVLQVWQMAESIYNDEEDDEEEGNAAEVADDDLEDEEANAVSTTETASENPAEGDPDNAKKRQKRA